MGGLSSYKLVLAMIGLHFVFAGLNLITGAALLDGLSTRVFVVYGQAIAFVIMASIALFTRRNLKTALPGLKTVALIFLTTLFGTTAYDNAYFEGLYLSSSIIATAMCNLIPATTFIVASILGEAQIIFMLFLQDEHSYSSSKVKTVSLTLARSFQILEKFKAGRLRNIAKVVGTLFCVGGAICMALVTGPVISNHTKLLELNSTMFDLNLGGVENLQLGCLLLFFACCCSTFWVIMQVPVSSSCPDLMYSTLWMCFFATTQSMIFTFIIEPDLNVWHLHSLVEVGSCLYLGITTAVSMFVRTWCISQRGPLFVALFNPLSTIITTIISTLFLNEELYLGSLIGSFAVILGLYVVLWGKAEESNEQIKGETDIRGLQYSERNSIQILIDESSSQTCTAYCKTTDLEEPLLAGLICQNEDESMKAKN